MSPTFLTRVILKNYKSIAACDVRFGPLSFLLGPNGAGKSNFLDALRFVTDSLRTSLEHAIRDRGGFLTCVRRFTTLIPTMKKIASACCCFLAGTALLALSGLSRADEQKDAFFYNRLLGRGINLGNALDAPKEGGPRPAVCDVVTNQTGPRSPARARAIASVLVEPASSKATRR